MQVGSHSPHVGLDADPDARQTLRTVTGRSCPVAAVAESREVRRRVGSGADRLAARAWWGSRPCGILGHRGGGRARRRDDAGGTWSPRSTPPGAPGGGPGPVPRCWSRCSARRYAAPSHPGSAGAGCCSRVRSSGRCGCWRWPRPTATRGHQPTRLRSAREQPRLAARAVDRRLPGCPAEVGPPAGRARRPARTGRPTSRATRRGRCCFFVVLVRLGLGSTSAGASWSPGRGDDRPGRDGHAAGSAPSVARRRRRSSSSAPPRSAGRSRPTRCSPPSPPGGWRRWRRCDVGARDPRSAWSLPAGLLLGCRVMLSYGLPLLGSSRSRCSPRPRLAAAARSRRSPPGRARLRRGRLRLVGGPRWSSASGTGRRRHSPTGRLLDVGEPGGPGVLRGSAVPAGSPALVRRRRADRPGRRCVTRPRPSVAADALADEPGRGGADLAPVRAVARRCRPGTAAADGWRTPGAGASRLRAARRAAWWSTCSTRAGRTLRPAAVRPRRRGRPCVGGRSAAAKPRSRGGALR